MRRRNLGLILLTIILINVFLLLRSTQHMSDTPPPFKSLHTSRQDPVTEQQDVNQERLILAYTKVYGREFDVSTYGRNRHEIQKVPNPMELCEYKCRWSTNKSEYAKSDAVIFHLYNNLRNKDFIVNDLPLRQSVQQKWILMAREPQAFFYPEQLKLLDDKFNLTMTFQFDSDVSIPYGAYWDHPESSLAHRAKMKLDYMTGKSKMVAWIVSNCKTSSKREEYVAQLQKFISVDIYGKCGNLTTNIKGANEFRDQIAKQYKFYIAFENSDCDDYISEKFWNSLHIGLIPIVRGMRSNYKDLAPPDSFIQADSFITPQKLAEYLIEISSNPTLFHRHHEWRRKYDANYKFFTTNDRWMCDLCKEVHNPRRQEVSIYQHFSENTRCYTYLDQKGRNRAGEHVEDITRK